MFTEKGHAGGFIISEANGNRSREAVTIVSGQNLQAGAVLGKITSGGKYTAYDSNASDGSETGHAVLIGACDASAGDKSAAVIARDAEVNGDELVYKVTSPVVDQPGAIVDLAAAGIGIIVR